MKRGALSILLLLLSATVFSEIVLAEDDEKDAKKRAEKRNDNAAAETVVPSAEKATFHAHLVPVLKRRCLGCHGGDRPKGKFSVESLELFLAGGRKKGATVVKRKPDESVVFQMISGTLKPMMPPKKADPLSDAESLCLNADGCITDIGGAVSDINEIEAQYMGLMRFRKGGIDVLAAASDNWKSATRPWMDKRPVRQAYMTDLLMEMILMGRAVHAVPVEGGWLEIDTAGDLEAAEAMLADGAIRITGIPVA